MARLAFDEFYESYFDRVGRALVLAGADSGLGPRSIVYPALALALGLGTWLVLFRG